MSGREVRRSRARSFAPGVVWGVVASLVLALSPVSVVPVADAAGPRPGDGTTMATAGASCWGIKRAYPASRTGRYWLRTLQMPVAQRFMCQMSMDGGGWVLIGRGRNGWTFDEKGQRTAAQVSDVTRGIWAYPPAALSATTIDGLLGGRPVKDLADGVRIVRATDSSGSREQVVTWNFLDLDDWSWSFTGGHRLRSFTIDGVRYTGGNTRDSRDMVWGEVGTGNRRADDLRRWWIRDSAADGPATWGFAYGSKVRGTSASRSAVWSPTNGGNALAFTQIWIRPQIVVNTPPVMPASGLAATTVPAGMSSVAEPMQAGVVGVLKVGDSEPSLDVPVMAFAEHDGRIIVGGKFAQVELGQGGTRHDQPYLAAFDLDTGRWDPTFRPVLDGTVWDMAMTSTGLLIVAGQFTTVNGEPHSALVALDPATGAVVPSWRVDIGLTCGEPDIACADGLRPLVRAIDIEGDWVYLGGNFSRVTDSVKTYRVGRVARVRVSDGTMDSTGFRPVPDLPVADIDATPSRVYLAGFFTAVNGTPVESVAVVATGTGQLVPGLQPVMATAILPARRYQQAVLEVGNTLWHTGSEHTIQARRRSDLSLVRAWMTGYRGGDGQVAATDGTQVFVGSHVDSNLLTDATRYPTMDNWTRADQSRWVTAFDATTRRHDRSFVIEANSASGEGAWELLVDSRGCLWIGGDFVGSSVVNGARRYAAGFFPVCAKDSVAPSSPSGLRVSGGARARTLSWTPSRDDRGGYVRYEILRHDRVVAVTLRSTWTDTSGALPARYAVRAVDAAGNRSATTPVVGR